MAKATIHFMVDDPAGQIPFVRPNTQTRNVDKGFCRPACKGPKSTMPKHATGEPDGVTCDACKATAEWKQAMANLLTEREVPATDPQWAGLPVPAAASPEPVSAPASSPTPMPAQVTATIPATPTVVGATPPPSPQPTPPDPGPITTQAKGT
jgi:molecular chaperone DnaK